MLSFTKSETGTCGDSIDSVFIPFSFPKTKYPCHQIHNKPPRTMTMATKKIVLKITIKENVSEYEKVIEFTLSETIKNICYDFCSLDVRFDNI